MLGDRDSDQPSAYGSDAEGVEPFKGKQCVDTGDSMPCKTDQAGEVFGRQLSKPQHHANISQPIIQALTMVVLVGQMLEGKECLTPQKDGPSSRKIQL